MSPFACPICALLSASTNEPIRLCEDCEAEEKREDQEQEDEPTGLSEYEELRREDYRQRWRDMR